MSKKKAENLLEQHYKQYLNLTLDNKDLGMLEGIIEQTFYAGAAAGAATVFDEIIKGEDLEEIWKVHIEPPLEKFL